MHLFKDIRRSNIKNVTVICEYKIFLSGIKEDMVIAPCNKGG